MYQFGMKSSNLVGLDRQQLADRVEALGERAFRGKQLFHQIYRRKIRDFDRMTDLAVDFRRRLTEQFHLSLPGIRQRRESADGTVKFLLELEDGRCIEMVCIPEEERSTLCISSQVGCDVGCTFCLTARMGFQRNLTPGEIVGQVLLAIDQGCVPENGFNIVFMGMGEPLYNYRNLMQAFRIMLDEEGMNLSYRKITVSTSGIVPVIERLASEPVVPNLAISLNATDDATRDRIMPVNRKWNLARLLSACRRFPLEPRRRITFEYVLLAGENDSPEDARRLVELLRGIPSKVNLIPYNPNPGLAHRRPKPEQVARFQAVLSAENLAGFVRKTRGDDVSAACGQLAHFERSRDCSPA